MADRTTTEAAGRPPGGVMLVTLVVLLMAWHGPSLQGPFTDGQRGNCGAMFALFASNATALGWWDTLGVPVINPVPPVDEGRPLTYTHHPPGLPWLVQAASLLPVSIQTGSRLVALGLSALTVLLLADLASRLGGRAAGWAAGLLTLGLPAGHYHALLVNYETVALPALLAVTRVLVLGPGRAAFPLGLAAGLTDFIALVPLGLAWRRDERRRTLVLGLGAAIALVTASLAARELAPTSLMATLVQAVHVTPLAPDFTLGAWSHAATRHLWTLFGPATFTALVGLGFVLRSGSALQRRVLVRLTLVGGANVVLFGLHAIGHEHFWLLLLPACVLGSAWWPLSARARTALVAALLLWSAVAAHDQSEQRSVTRQADRAAAFAAVTDTDSVFVTPAGVPLVFLHAAGRHVVARAVADAEDAERAAGLYLAAAGLAQRPVVVFLPEAAPTPIWVSDLGAPDTIGAFTFRALRP